MQEKMAEMMAAHTATLAENAAALADKDATLAENAAALADKDATFAEQSETIQGNVAVIAEHTAALSEKVAELAERDQKIADLREGAQVRWRRACLGCGVFLGGCGAYHTAPSGSSSAEEASSLNRSTLPWFRILVLIRIVCVVSSLPLCDFCRTGRGWKGSRCCSSRHGSASWKRRAPASSPLLVRLPSGSACRALLPCMQTAALCAWESADMRYPGVASARVGVCQAAMDYIIYWQ